MKRYTFHQLFKFNGRKQIEALVPVKIGMVTIMPGGTVDKGVILAGIDLFNFVDATYDCKLQKHKNDTIYVIRRIYVA